MSKSERQWVDILLSCSWACDSLSTSDVVRVPQPSRIHLPHLPPHHHSWTGRFRKKVSLNQFLPIPFFVASKEQNFWIILQNLQRLNNQWLVLCESRIACAQMIFATSIHVWCYLKLLVDSNWTDFFASKTPAPAHGRPLAPEFLEWQVTNVCSVEIM